MLTLELIEVLAKKGRIELLRTLKSYPDKDFTINDLAKVSKVATMTTWRSVRDLKKVGLVKTRRFGNAISVSLTDDREKMRVLRLVPETDPQRNAAKLFASKFFEHEWATEFRLFGSIGRGEHSPGDEVDIAVVYDEGVVSEDEARSAALETANAIRAETNVAITPLCISKKDMARKGGLAAELRDKEVIWRR